MVRKPGPPSDDPFLRRSPADRGSFVDDALPRGSGLDEAEDEDEPQPFRRASRRVPVRRGALPRKTISRVRRAALWLAALAAVGAGIAGVRGYALRAARFRLSSAGNIEVTGEAPNSRAAVMEKMREVLGRNIFQVSLAERKQELEKIPWVESAAVIRLLPNHLRVVVKERTPVAFADIGGRIELIDAQGVVMEMSPGVPSDYSFPVVRGMTESDPLSTRAARMKIYERLMHELDGDDGGAQSATSSAAPSASQGKPRYSRNLEEVDLSDPDDVKVTVKGGSGTVLLHLGNENFLQRFMLFLSNVQKWEQERGKLESVDLRYGRQVILNPDMAAAPPPRPPEAAKAPPPKAPVQSAGARLQAAKAQHPLALRPQAQHPQAQHPHPRPVTAKALKSRQLRKKARK